MLVMSSIPSSGHTRQTGARKGRKGIYRRQIDLIERRKNQNQPKNKRTSLDAWECSKSRGQKKSAIDMRPSPPFQIALSHSLTLGRLYLDRSGSWGRTTPKRTSKSGASGGDDVGEADDRALMTLGGGMGRWYERNLVAVWLGWTRTARGGRRSWEEVSLRRSCSC